MALTIKPIRGGIGFGRVPSDSGRGTRQPWGPSGCSCRRKLPVEFRGCGELKLRVSNVNKEKCDQACQLFRLRMTLQEEGDRRNSWG